LIDEAGSVVGITDWKFTDAEGISFVVAASEISAFLNSGRTRTIDIDLGCEDSEFELVFDDPQLTGVQTMFGEYAQLINSAHEGEAYDRFAGPRLRDVISRDDFIDGTSTSLLEELKVFNVFWTGEGTAEAWVTFVSYQDPIHGTDGQSCSIWDLTYDLLLEDGTWKIQRAKNEPASPTEC
jgi:hypothetical protein